jgi:polysaccharide deacetylase family protein (PEP-CTERM system associated)
LLPPRDSIHRQMDRLLQLLEAGRTKATFFVLGLTADDFPDLVKRVAGLGHEIACHGHSHRVLQRMTREEFREDTHRGKARLEDLVGEPVLGYRAPEFSLRSDTLWALEVLAELGFAYDSSIFPIRHRRYGIPAFCRQPACYYLPNGAVITEIPLATIRWGRGNLPVAGGGYFRLLPLRVIRAAVRQLEAESLPMVTYVHPYEFDSEPLDIFHVLQHSGWTGKLNGVRFNWMQNLGRSSMAAKLTALVTEFQFTACREFLAQTDLQHRRSLLVGTN